MVSLCRRQSRSSKLIGQIPKTWLGLRPIPIFAGLRSIVAGTSNRFRGYPTCFRPWNTSWSQHVASLTVRTKPILLRIFQASNTPTFRIARWSSAVEA